MRHSLQCHAARARNGCSAVGFLLFFLIAGCVTKPVPVSSRVLEAGETWSVTESVYSRTDIQALPVYTRLADERGGDAVEKAVAWCEDGRTPCCYQTQHGEPVACYQLAGGKGAAEALGKWLRELLKRNKKDAPEQKPPQIKAKPVQPDLPPGFKSNRELGEFLKWPTPQNPSGGPMPSADQLRQRGVTRQEIQRWQEFYRDVGMHNSGNPSADPRVDYLEQLKNILD